MRSILPILLLGIVACEGPTGPQGKPGPAGEQGEKGSPSTGTIIEKRIDLSAYDEDGFIFIEDERINPESFRALYLKLEFSEGDVFIPLDYLLIYSVSLIAEALEGETPILIIGNGGLGISDPEGILFDAAISGYLRGTSITLAILVEL